MLGWGGGLRDIGVGLGKNRDVLGFSVRALLGAIWSGKPVCLGKDLRT